jgi:hypothetical protein
LLTTAEALHQAYKTGQIKLDEADEIWAGMLSKRRKLPAASFTEYLSNVEKGGDSQL